MSRFKQITDESGHIVYIETNALGQSLLTTPKLNKGSAFDQKERKQFRLLGKLPYCVESLDQQVKRIYQQFSKKESDLQRYVYLRSLHDTNETLFYKLVSCHLKEMLPIIYTPTIGTAVEQFSHEFRRPRGLYMTYPDRDYIDEIIENRLNPEVDIVVMTDGEGVLGIGDQGIGGMDICIAKSMVYVLCGGINPHRLLPIQIDVGTNNDRLLNDPAYLGWRHHRLIGEAYHDMVGRIIRAIQQKLPNVYLHWEDFGRENARYNLQSYQNEMCTFNDDMQGTGAVTLAALLAAVGRTGMTLKDQRIVLFGAGTAGTGIADQLYASMIREGLCQQGALSRLYLMDKQGLLHAGMSDLTPFQRPYARSLEEIQAMPRIDLYHVVEKVKPTVLIGCSSQRGSFTEAVIKKMADYVEHPIIFPLSNPTDKAEATPVDLLRWTQGKAFIATGSPFPPVHFQNRVFYISQCNNALIYPGIGLGVVTVKAKRLSDGMIWKACEILSRYPVDLDRFPGALLPDFDAIHDMSRCIAAAVAEQACEEGLAQISEGFDLIERIKNQFWLPQYYPYRYAPLL